MYSTPKIDGFSATAAFIPEEDSEAPDGDGEEDDGIADHISLALTYSTCDLLLQQRLMMMLTTLTLCGL